MPMITETQPMTKRNRLTDHYRFVRACRKCRTLRDATRVWNWADHQAIPEAYWETMARMLPWAFRSTDNYNSMRFTYDD